MNLFCILQPFAFVLADVGVDFTQCLAENEAMVFSFALRFLRDRETARELAQDVFLQMYTNMRRIESPAHATWWLRRAICHRCIDEARKRRLRPRVHLEAVPEPAMQRTDVDPMLHDRLRSLIADLPENARNVVILRYQEDLDPSEISTLLDMPISTVKSHLHRSLTVLRGRLQKQETCR
jgi:RNA polymerase sigma-70 factor (ECF subfamily)